MQIQSCFCMCCLLCHDALIKIVHRFRIRIDFIAIAEIPIIHCIQFQNMICANAYTLSANTTQKIIIFIDTVRNLPIANIAFMILDIIFTFRYDLPAIFAAMRILRNQMFTSIRTFRADAILPIVFTFIDHNIRMLRCDALPSFVAWLLLRDFPYFFVVVLTAMLAYRLSHTNCRAALYVHIRRNIRSCCHL